LEYNIKKPVVKNNIVPQIVQYFLLLFVITSHNDYYIMGKVELFVLVSIWFGFGNMVKVRLKEDIDVLMEVVIVSHLFYLLMHLNGLNMPNQS
jgi:hypothetical protein